MGTYQAARPQKPDPEASPALAQCRQSTSNGKKAAHSSRRLVLLLVTPAGQQRSGWTSTRTSTMQLCLLPEMSLMESKCDPRPLAVLLLGILCVCVHARACVRNKGRGSPHRKQIRCQRGDSAQGYRGPSREARGDRGIQTAVWTIQSPLPAPTLFSLADFQV